MLAVLHVLIATTELDSLQQSLNSHLALRDLQVMKHDWRRGGVEFLMAAFSGGGLVTYPIGTAMAAHWGIKALFAYPLILGAKVGVVLWAGR